MLYAFWARKKRNSDEANCNYGNISACLEHHKVLKKLNIARKVPKHVMGSLECQATMHWQGNLFHISLICSFHIWVPETHSTAIWHPQHSYSIFEHMGLITSVLIPVICGPLWFRCYIYPYVPWKLATLSLIRNSFQISTSRRQQVPADPERPDVFYGR